MSPPNATQVKGIQTIWCWGDNTNGKLTGDPQMDPLCGAVNCSVTGTDGDDGKARNPIPHYVQGLGPTTP